MHEKSIWALRKKILKFGGIFEIFPTKFIMGKYPRWSFPIVNLVVTFHRFFLENHSNFWSRLTFWPRFFFTWSPSHFLSIAHVFTHIWDLWEKLLPSLSYPPSVTTFIWHCVQSAMILWIPSHNQHSWKLFMLWYSYHWFYRISNQCTRPIS